MQGWFFPLSFIIGFPLLYLFIRNDVNEDKALTKKGFIKLGSFFLIIFMVAFFLGLLAR
ncbi:hypothetical protein ERJ70_00710 [Sediminibacillus dalangtanensis]|uniref:Uncharacterized protein n=1 Tax=Sediminibacillus dalangtanensis TaxID=2729421 RepID=A0ABX7VMD3_9BACI|nr:DUF3976 domain-containing protein [Sediminibacillus dalangtanensis]QTM97972.1 hypothetical protein ERJ70_00710 [Sediminibacillus dalangtanensis]